jgi:hypothetical protein
MPAHLRSLAGRAALGSVHEGDEELEGDGGGSPATTGEYRGSELGRLSFDTERQSANASSLGMQSISYFRTMVPRDGGGSLLSAPSAGDAETEGDENSQASGRPGPAPAVRRLVTARPRQAARPAAWPRPAQSSS